MDIPNHDELLAKVEAFRAQHDIAETRFGRDAINNPNFIRGLRDGISPTLDTLTKVAAYMTRIEREATTRAKLNAPLDAAAGEEVDQPLPFSRAPVNPTGASSPTSSSTTAAPTTRVASGSCPSCCGPDAGPSAPTGGESLVAAPSTPTGAARK